MSLLARETVELAMYRNGAVLGQYKMSTKRYKNLTRFLTCYMCVVFCFALLISVLTLSDIAYASAKLKTKVPDLCYDCHKDLKKGLSDKYRHFLFKQGKCITCHNAHVSKIEGLMIDNVNDLCLNCHDDVRLLVEKSIIHSALRENECTECHFAHSGENAHLLVKEEKDLCLGCHEDLNKKFDETYACIPFKEGKCSACHNSHASPEDDLLSSSPKKLCKECHGPKCKAGDVSINALVGDVDCTTCHSGHSSMDKGLLGPYGHTVFLEQRCEECHNPIKAGEKASIKFEGEKLCFSCHPREKAKYIYIDNDIHVKDAANPCTICHDRHASGNKNLTMNETRVCKNCHEDTEKRTAAMIRALRTVKCEPIRERKCFECHIPSHSDRPLNYRADEIGLCARCHAAQHKISHPVGPDVIDPRDGQPITCISCHSMHSSKIDFMLTHDRQRALCIQCHKIY